MEPGNESARRWRSRSISGLRLAGIFLLALAVRAILLPAVVLPTGVLLPVAGDPYYHLRRIGFAVANFPAALDFDAYLNFPDGARAVWPPAFDWTIAAVARLWAGTDPIGVERVAVWAPAVLGALGAVGAALLMGRHVSRHAGLLAGLFLAVLPAHYFYSQIGYVDHHAAVGVLALGLLGAGMALVGPARGSLLVRGFVLGGAMAAALLVWPGALLHVAIVEALVVLWALTAEDRAAAVARAWAVAAAHLVCALVLAPMGLQPPVQFGAWSPMVLSYFQPVYFGAAATALAGVAVLSAHTPVGASRARRLGAAAALGAGGVLAAILLVPGLADSLFYASGWFGKVEDLQNHVSELQPLLAPKGRFNPAVAVGQFTVLLLLFPFAWGWLAFRAWRDGAGWDRALLLVWALQFFVMAMAQRRFANSFSVGFVLIWVALAADVWPRLRAAQGLRRAAQFAGVGLLALLCANAILSFYSPRLLGSLAALQNPQVRARGTLSGKGVLTERAAIWLKGASPKTSGWLDPGEEPEYGVLTGWGFGHLVRYRAERPLVQDNFAVYGGRENYEAAWAYYDAREEDDALAILERLRVRYVFADRLGAGAIHGYDPLAMSGRLIRWFGSAARWTDPATKRDARDPRPRRPPDGLVWAHGPRAGSLAQAAAPGGRGVGARARRARGRGGAARRACQRRGRARARRKHDGTRRSHQRAGADGRYSIRVPYPTDVAFSDRVRVLGPYTVEASAGGSVEGPTASRRLRVPESAVREGVRVEGPSFGP